MRVQREFDLATVQILETLPISELHARLGIVESKTPKSEQPSKWAKVAQEAQETSPLSGLSGYIQECSKEFREDFEFKHDQE